MNVFDDDNPGGRDHAGLKSSGGKRTLILLMCDTAIENYRNVKRSVFVKSNSFACMSQ